MTAKAFIRIKKVYRPVSREIQGFRLQACIPNMTARRMKKSSKTESGFYASDELVPSFAGKYLIAESMDYTCEAHITQAEIDRFITQKVKWAGYSEVEWVKDKKDDPKPDAKVQAQIDDLLRKMGGEAPF